MADIVDWSMAPQDASLLRELRLLFPHNDFSDIADLAIGTVGKDRTEWADRIHRNMVGKILPLRLREVARKYPSNKFKLLQLANNCEQFRSARSAERAYDVLLAMRTRGGLWSEEFRAAIATARACYHRHAPVPLADLEPFLQIVKEAYLSTSK